MEDLANKKIGSIIQDGIDAPDIIAPPISIANGVIATPKQKDADEKKFIPVEAESSFPGGMNAWRRYLLKTIRYPEPAKENNIQGAVIVKFIVDKEGKVSNAEAISGPEELREEAVRVISRSGRWTPAIQNGRNVTSYKSQAIVFQLAE